MPVGLPSRLHSHRADVRSGLDSMPTGLGSKDHEENRHVHQHGPGNEEVPSPVQGLQDVPGPAHSTSSLHHLLHGQRVSHEEGSLHGLLDAAGNTDSTDSLLRLQIPLRDPHATHSLHGLLLRAAYRLPESAVQRLHAGFGNTNPQSALHGLPSGLRHEIRLSPATGSETGALHSDNLRAASRLPPGTGHNLLPAADRRAMVAAEAMGAVYWRLLRRMEDAKFRVLDPRPTRLGRLHKLALVFGTWWRIKIGSQSPNYGRD